MRRWILVAATAATAAFGAVGAPDAHAGTAECGEQKVEQPFLPFLDPLRYSLAPGGDFEPGHGWSLGGGAKVVGGNEPYFVHSPADTSSLYLPSGGSATSPWTCVNLIEHPTIRFFALSQGSPLSVLNVDVQYRTKSGSIRSLPALLPVSALTQLTWLPAPPMLIALDTVVNDLLTLDLSTAEVRFRFTATGGLFFKGKWRIDDFYVDPIGLRW